MQKTLRQAIPGRVLAAFAVMAVLAIGGGIAVAILSPGKPLPPLTSAQRHYLTLADQGLAKTSNWWNRKLSWYDAVLDDHSARPLAKLWDTNGLFETLDEVALAHPTTHNLAALTAFANGSERYWNPNLKPVGGYSPYIGDSKATQQTWYDDNGWIGLAFLDAYRATKNRRYLYDAERAFKFIAAGGWDTGPGGMWWSTAHPWRSGEALACASDLAASLYQETGKSVYLNAAKQYIGWADKHLLQVHGVYLQTADHPYPHLIEPKNFDSRSGSASPTSATMSPVRLPKGLKLPKGGSVIAGSSVNTTACPQRPHHCKPGTVAMRGGAGPHGPFRAANAQPTMVAMPHDGEGAMLAAITALCEKTGKQSWCRAAEKLAGAEIVWLAPFADGPQYDSILVRGLLTLYAHDHNARWYRFAVAIAKLITTHARTGAGLYLRGWDGRAVPSAEPRSLRTDAGSIGVFADLATVKPPS